MKLLAQMRTYLCLALVLCAVLSLANRHCYQIQMEEDATQCLDPTDNQWYPRGASWRNSECMACSCSGCCSMYSAPLDVPPDSVAVLDKEACEYIMIKKSNLSLERP